MADKDESSPPVTQIVVEDCEFPRGHGVVTFGSEATIVRDVIVRRCVVTGQNNLVRLKLRPDTPQVYENILFEDITLSGGAGRIFRVDPWMQLFDPEGREPQPSIVRNLTIRRVHGSYGTLGVFKGSPRDSLSGVVLEDIELTLTDTAFEVGDVRDVTTTRVTIDGQPWVFPRRATQ
jgi:alpha-L-rhamnosidase